MFFLAEYYQPAFYDARKPFRRALVDAVLASPSRAFFSRADCLLAPPACLPGSPWAAQFSLTWPVLVASFYVTSSSSIWLLLVDPNADDRRNLNPQHSLSSDGQEEENLPVEIAEAALSAEIEMRLDSQAAERYGLERKYCRRPIPDSLHVVTGQVTHNTC